MKKQAKKETPLNEWFSDHVVIMGSDNAVKKAVEKKIKDDLIKKLNK